MRQVSFQILIHRQILGFPDQDYLMNFEAPIIKEKNTLAVRFRLKMCEEGYFLSEMQNK